MFISKAEKTKLFEEIEAMKINNEKLLANYVKQTKLVNTLTVHIHNLEVRIAEIEGVKAKKLTHQTKWTPERRAAQSEIIKKMWADKRVAKLPANTVVGVPV